MLVCRSPSGSVDYVLFCTRDGVRWRPWFDAPFFFDFFDEILRHPEPLSASFGPCASLVQRSDLVSSDVHLPEGSVQMAVLWYYIKNGQQVGPVSSVQLKQLAVSGDLQPNDLVWKEGMSQWVAAQRLKGLFHAATAVAPPPTVAIQHEVLRQRTKGLRQSIVQQVLKTLKTTNEGTGLSLSNLPPWTKNKWLWIGVACVLLIMMLSSGNSAAYKRGYDDGTRFAADMLSIPRRYGESPLSVLDAIKDTASDEDYTGFASTPYPKGSTENKDYRRGYKDAIEAVKRRLK